MSTAPNGTAPPPARIGAWTPGLDDRPTLRTVYATMPGDPQAAIPWYVRLLENPASPVALPGAIDLFGHDCVHITLGRGMLPQDEAFVIGVTMGATGRLSGWQHRLYATAARRLYRGPYRLGPADLLVFDLGVAFAKLHRLPPLQSLPWHELLDRPLGEIRAAAGISRAGLLDAYARERRLLPGTEAARRLPTAAPQPRAAG
ncbi:hypothetical protein AB0H83_36965 [Dactylosporangium sp. NPDC050688]|uniref:hypothetical protein n=1 Tax=Dactylosporangium sp. NPDC050688 TaxID=3157217 RepID=UPI003411D05B